MCRSNNMITTTEEQQPRAKIKLAATEEHGLAPHLIKAKSDLQYQSPILAWALVVLCTASFYLGPLLLLSPFLLYHFHPTAAVVLFCTNLYLAFHPVSPWPRFRRCCQLFYTVFNFHHNITPNLDEITMRNNHLSIVAMHPHAIIPLHGFIWCAICDQLLPHMYGYGCTTVCAFSSIAFLLFFERCAYLYSYIYNCNLPFISGWSAHLASATPSPPIPVGRLRQEEEGPE